MADGLEWVCKNPGLDGPLVALGLLRFGAQPGLRCPVGAQGFMWGVGGPRILKIAIVAASPVPFVIGGAENLWTGWLAALNQQPGVEAELIKLPSPERNFAEIVASYRRFAELDLLHFDRVISTKYPAWMVSHPDHHVFLQHKLRGLYDTWPLGLSTALPPGQPPVVARLQQVLASARGQRQALGDIFGALAEVQAAADLPPGLLALPGALLRQVVHTLDDIGLARQAIRRYAAISATVAARPGYFPADVDVATEVEVIHHPTLPRRLPSVPGTQVPAGCIFTASRLDGPKRMDWVVQAYLAACAQAPAHAPITAPLVVAGDGPQRQRLEALAQGHPQVMLVGRLTDEALAQAYQQAVLVPFVPDREDYGLITLEALQAGKPVLTCSDAGGVTELVQHGVNGLITEPSPQALAQGLLQMLQTPGLLQRLSQAAAPSVAHIEWGSLAQSFCQPYPRVAVVNTFSIFPPGNGGQMRIWQLYSELARRADVRLVNLCHGGARHHRRTLSAGLQEVVVPSSPEHAAFERELTGQLKASCTDMAALLQPGLNPAWLEEIAQACQWADLVVSSHPYSFPAIREVWAGPVIYEAANVELDLKESIFPHAADALAAVRRTEGELATQAPAVMCCSTQDAQRMQALYALPHTPAVVPNGVDVRAYPVPSPAERLALRQRLGLPEQPVALYVGSLHGPNVDALLALIDVAQACPNIAFAVVGNVCNAPRLKAAAQASPLPPNLLLLGRVSDAELRVWLSAADVGLNPMVSGSGTNLKMLEYAAAGLPIVSTPFGGRGGLLESPTHFLAAEMPDFAATLQACLAPGQAQARAQRAERARQQTLACGDWRVIAASLWAPLQALLGQQA
jgi:glycosyltransferase involved in cell wall biosynthesis